MPVKLGSVHENENGGKRMSRTRTVDIGLDENVYAANAVERDLNILILTPVTHLGHICAAGVVFFISWKSVRNNSTTLSRSNTHLLPEQYLSPMKMPI